MTDLRVYSTQLNPKSSLFISISHIGPFSYGFLPYGSEPTKLILTQTHSKVLNPYRFITLEFLDELFSTTEVTTITRFNYKWAA